LTKLDITTIKNNTKKHKQPYKKAINTGRKIKANGTTAWFRGELTLSVFSGLMA